MRCKNFSIIWVRILSAVSPIASSKDAAFRRRICPVNLHQKFTGFTHSDKETGFLVESTNHNQELSKKPGFWPPPSALRNRVFGPIYASQPRIIEKTRFLAPAVSPKKPGFWPNLRITTKNYRKNPVSGHPCVSLQRNRVFGRIHGVLILTLKLSNSPNSFRQNFRRFN